MRTWHSNDQSLCLTTCRDDIPEGYFGHVSAWWCDACKGHCGEPEYHMTHRQTLEDPEEGVEVCPSCGSEDCGENQNDHGMRIVNRYTMLNQFGLAIY